MNASDGIAIIDTGTNSTRLLIAEVVGGEVHERERRTTITRLGENVDRTGELGDAAMARVDECIGLYSGRIAAAGVDRSFLIATSSVRDARNGEAFIHGLSKRYGMAARVLDGGREAALAFAGATIGHRDQRIMLFDIGGGSTELATGTAPRVEQSVSMRLGCVRVRERYLGSDPVSAEEMEEARQRVRDALAKGTAGLRLDSGMRTLAVAGTMTTLAAYDLGLESYDRDAVHGHQISAGRVAGLLEELAAMDLRERVAIPVMERGRADVIVAGALIADELMRLAAVGTVTISENDILDGAALAFSGDS